MVLTAVAITVVCVVSLYGQHVNGKPPNILLVLADDYGWNDIGYHGSEIKTPNLDALAESGVKLDNYYVQPICTPTRSQLMSGRYQIHTGLQHSIIWADQPNGLPLKFPTLADMLKKQHYSTHIVGKWHLGFYKKEYTPLYRGFDSFLGYLTGSEHYFTHVRCNGYKDIMLGKQQCGLDFRDNMEVLRSENGTYSAHVFAQRASKIIKQHAAEDADKPLFLYMPFQSVHMPLEVPDEYVDRYSFIQNKARRTYAGMVSAMDEAVANVTKAMKQHGLWDNTILVFSTDNGGQVKYGGNNWPLRGNKATLWEGGMRGVGFVHSNLLARRNVTSRELMHVSDWFPTLVGLAGGDTSGLKLDGHDVWNAISKGDPSPRKELLHNIDPLYQAHGDKLKGSPFDNRIRAAVRVGNWKLITGDPGLDSWFPPPHDYDALSPEGALPGTAFSQPKKGEKNIWLFDVVKDPEERKDLSGLYPDVVKMMLGKLADYNATAVTPFYPRADPRSNPQLHGGVWGPWMD